MPRRRGPRNAAPGAAFHRAANEAAAARVSFETSFDSKQPKLEPKLVSALSETKRLFRLFRFCTETASFGVSIKPKQTEDQPKQTETNRNKSINRFSLRSQITARVLSILLPTDQNFGCTEAYLYTRPAL